MNFLANFRKESITVDKELKNNVARRVFDHNDALVEARRLSKVSPRPEPAEETLHIVVQCPTVGECHRLFCCSM